MKKSILLMLPFALGLAACSGGSPLDKGNVITPKFMERNFVNTRTPVETGYNYKVDEKIEIGAYNPLGVIDEEQNFFVMQDADGKIGVYALSEGKFIVGPAEFTLGVDLSAQFVDLDGDDTDDLIFFLTASFNEEAETASYKVIDELGNEVFAIDCEDTDLPRVSGRFLEPYERSENEYFIIFAESYAARFDGQYAVYNFDGSIAKKGSYTEYVDQAGAAYSLGYTQVMADYGHPELAMVQSMTTRGARLSFYNTKEGKFVSSFDVKGYPAYCAGDFFLTQEVTEVEERATDYDFYAEGVKYNVTTTKINYTNGNKETLDVKVLFTGAVGTEMYDEKGVYKYGYFSQARVIKDDKTLDSEYFAFLLDENVGIAADLTGVNFLGLEKYGDYYVDFDNAIVYDGKLNETAFFPSIDEVSESGIIFYNQEGFYGLASFDGKVILPAIYSFLMELNDGIFYYGNYKTEKYAKLENGALTELGAYEADEWTGYYGQFSEYSEYEDADGNAYYVSCLDGKKADFAPFEPAETDTYLGYLTPVEYGYAFPSYSHFGHVLTYAEAYQTADGALYMVREQRVATVEYQTIAE